MKSIKEGTKEYKPLVETFSDLFESNSPITLKDESKRILKKIGFEEAIDNNETELFAYINEYKPKTNYDLQELCAGLIKYIMTSTESEIFDEVERFLYNNPEYNKPEYFLVAGFYLRDKYIEKNSNLTKKQTK